MIQGGHDLGFPLKPRQPLRVLGELFWQHLDRHFTAQVGVLGSVHLPHTALAYLFENFVVVKGLAEHEIPLDAVALNGTPGGGGRQWEGWTSYFFFKAFLIAASVSFT